MLKSNTNTTTQIDLNKESELETNKNKNKNINERKHKQFSSLEDLNKFLDNLFQLLRIVKGFENIQYIIYD